MGLVPETVTAVPAPGQVDEDVVDNAGRLMAGAELVQLEAMVFRTKIGGDGPAVVGSRRTAEADLDDARAVGVVR